MQLDTTCPIAPRLQHPVKPTVLFVDDEERILRTLRMMFAQHYKVLTTTSGYEALDILRSERVHTLVSDQRMPIMPGVELLRQAREVSPNTMRLLLTGYSDLEAVVGSINEGEVFRYITKPWNPDEIRSTIGAAVEIALQLESVVPPLPEASPQRGISRILVVDDDPSVAIQVKSLIDEESRGSLLVEWASDVDGVFQIMERSEIAMVISDVRLGGEDITEIVKSLKRHQPDVVTMGLTAYQDSAMLASLINQAQVHRFMLKPIRPKFLWRNIESCLEHHHKLKAAPKLAIRHKVDNSAPPMESASTARRIMGFFRHLGERLH